MSSILFQMKAERCFNVSHSVWWDKMIRAFRMSTTLCNRLPLHLMHASSGWQTARCRCDPRPRRISSIHSPGSLSVAMQKANRVGQHAPSYAWHACLAIGTLHSCAHCCPPTWPMAGAQVVVPSVLPLVVVAVLVLILVRSELSLVCAESRGRAESFQRGCHVLL
jgi:hypothetical protein